MEYLFKLVYDSLKFLERTTGLSYEEINIIIWFIAIPLSWAYLLDKIVGKHYLKITFVLFIIISLLIIDDFTLKCEMFFYKSVDFLNAFNSLGSNYKSTSVIICLFIPILIYFILFQKAFVKRKK